MGESRIAHDAAWTTTLALMAILEPVFRPEELRDARDLIYDHLKAAIEAAFLMRGREMLRMKPERN